MEVRLLCEKCKNEHVIITYSTPKESELKCIVCPKCKNRGLILNPEDK